jgi:hypothetical protein
MIWAWWQTIFSYGLLALVAVLAMLAPWPTTGANGDLVSFPDNPAGGLTVSDTEPIVLHLIPTPDAPKQTVRLFVSAFQAAGKEPVIASLSVEEMQDIEPANPINIPLDTPVLTLKLALNQPLSTETYTGFLAIILDNRVRQIENISLKSPTPPPEGKAKLTVSAPAEILYHSLSMFWDEDSTFSLLLREIGGNAAANAVTMDVRVTGMPDGIDFQPTKQLTWLWEGRKPVDLWQSAATDEAGSPLTVPAHSQIKVIGQLKDLEAGQYKLKFEIAAANLEASTLPTAELTIKIRNGLGGAVLVLVLAIALSYLGTKSILSIRKRGEILQRIDNVQTEWLRDAKPILPVVAIRSILQQANRRCAPFFPPAVNLIEDRLTKAELMMVPVDRIRKIRQIIGTWAQPTMVTRRAEKAVRTLASRLHPDDATKEFCSEIDTKLGNVERQITSSELKEFYWASLKGDIDHLLSKATEPNFDPERWENIEKLRKKMEGVAPPKDINKAVAIEEDYAKLKLVWDVRRNKDLAKSLLDMAAGNQHVSKMFDAVDDEFWKNLKTAGADGFRLRSPRPTSSQPLQAFQLIMFELEPKDPEIGDNYLFKHGLGFKWSIKFTENGRVVSEDTAETHEPRLYHYVPRRGQIDVSVILVRGPRETLPLDPLLKDQPVGKSEEFRMRAAFQTAEVLALGIALLVALLSGLQTLYFTNPVFGSAKDYVALALWGFGVDQATNFIKLLRPNVTPTS